MSGKNTVACQNERGGSVFYLIGADLTAQNVPMSLLERKSCSAETSRIVYNVEQAITKGGTGMNGYRLTEDKLAGFAEHLKGEEQGDATIEKYVRNVRFFAQWLGGAAVTKEAVARDRKKILLTRFHTNQRYPFRLSSIDIFHQFVKIGKRTDGFTVAVNVMGSEYAALF